MRIIVGHDYYDNVLAYGHDDSIVFVRSKSDLYTVKEMNERGIHIPPLSLAFRPVDNHSRSVRFFSFNELEIPKDNGEKISAAVEPVVAIVCGKRYNGIRLFTFSLTKDQYFWSLETFDSYLASINIKYSSPSIWKSVNLAEYFNHGPVSKSVLNSLIENKIVIATFSNKTALLKRAYQILDEKLWMVNGCNLRDIEFYKVMDAFTIFQEIEMFLGGVIPGSGNKMVEITDNNIKITKAGFDKFSFRKQKEKT